MINFTSINEKRELTPSTFIEFCHKKLNTSPFMIKENLQAWLKEDMPLGDITLSCLKENACHGFYIIAKEPLTLCGLEFMAETFRLAGFIGTLSSAYEDGQRVEEGQKVLEGQGSLHAILMAERTSLNLSCHLSGIATHTRRFVDLIHSIFDQKTPTLLDTRKTTPGLKVFEKYATRVGGARNHRYALSSGAMLKENHLRAFSSIKEPVQSLQTSLPLLSKIEVEVTNLEEFKEAMEAGAHVIMLDHFTPSNVKEALALKKTFQKEVEIEISGNLTEENLMKYQGLEIDYVSTGALIHQSRWSDMSLQVLKN
jgi:nicotinate-nucleotide pyrophosphorylase (carboxylating)